MLVVNENDVSAVVGLAPQALLPAPAATGSVVEALLSVIPMSVASNEKPVQYTGSENVTVIVVLPTAPWADAIVGLTVSGAVAVAWRACGAEAKLPATSWKSWLLVELVPTDIRVVSTNAPFGMGVVSVRIDVVTALSSAALQVGVLSPVIGFAAGAETLRTVQSLAGPPTRTDGLHTGSLHVMVTKLPETVKLLNFGFVVSTYVKLRPLDAPAPGLVRVTVTAPTACAGVSTVTAVAPQLVTVALVPPNETVGNVGLHTMPEPEIVTTVPPLAVPVVGVSDVSVAAPAAAPVLASW